MGDPKRFEVMVGGERLRLRVEGDEADLLRKAADDVQARIDSYKESGVSASTQRLAVLAALDLAHELLRDREGDGSEAEAEEQMNKQVDRIIARIDRVLKENPA